MARHHMTHLLFVMKFTFMMKTPFDSQLLLSLLPFLLNIGKFPPPNSPLAGIIIQIVQKLSRSFVAKIRVNFSVLAYLPPVPTKRFSET